MVTEKNNIIHNILNKFELNSMAALVEDVANLKDDGAESESGVLIPQSMVYCPHCTMPPEFCEHGPCFDRCLPWLRDNFPQYLSTEHLERSMAAASLAGGEAGEKGEAVATEPPKKQKNSKKAAAPPEIKVVVAKIQRQKRKFITAIAGLETVPDLRLKDATKVLGKKFSSGASVNETPSGAKEVVIQGDFLFDVPELLVNQFKVPATAIFIMEDKTLRPYA